MYHFCRNVLSVEICLHELRQSTIDFNDNMNMNRMDCNVQFSALLLECQHSGSFE
jgi:hypothetical protein